MPGAHILLGAMEKRIGGCRIANINHRLADLLELPEYLRLSLVIALGKPKETVIIDECPDEGSIKYWRDEHAVHHVPKRSLQSCLLNCPLN